MDNISLKGCHTLKHLASLFGMDYTGLSSIIYPNTNHLYVSFIVPKKNGAARIIDAPNPRLKTIQGILSKALKEFYAPRINTHGFVCGRSIISNAAQHTNKKYILNLDFKDFFSSIHFGRIRNLFQSEPFSFPHEVATVLAHICCLNGKLPQGAPTSPILTNMIAFKLDNELLKLSKENKCSVTRYVDDVTFSFSCNKKMLPKDIITFYKGKELVVGDKLQRIIEKNGFNVNLNKLRLHEKNQRQQVTGLVVNEKVNVPRDFVIKTRSMLYAWSEFGLEAAGKEYLTNYVEKDYGLYDKRRIYKDIANYFELVIKGRINYIGMVRGTHDSIYKKLLYKFGVLKNAPNEELIKTEDDILSDSIFILENEEDISQGTAFLLEGIGLVTVWHVIESITKKNCPLLDFFRYYEINLKRRAALIKSCKKEDLAIFKPDNSFHDIAYLKKGDDSNLKPGFEIKLMGFPDYSQGDSYHCHLGKITQKKNLLGEDMWLVDIPILHGISGGPVFNTNNEVIGIAVRGTEKHNNETKSHAFIPISRLSKLL